MGGGRPAGPEARPSGLPSSVQELSRAKAEVLSERGQAEGELIKAKNQVRLEEVSPWPWPREGAAHCPLCPEGGRLRGWRGLPGWHSRGAEAGKTGAVPRRCRGD